MNDMGHDVFFRTSDRGTKAYASHERSGTKLGLERVIGVFSSCRWSLFHTARVLRSAFFTFGAGTDRGHDGQYGNSRPPKLTEACSAVSPTREALLQPLVIGGSSGSHDVIYPIPGGGLLGERPVVPRGRERTKREEQLQRQVEGDTAQGPVAKARRRLRRLPAWMSGMGIWQPDTRSIEDGLHSAWLAKERVKLTDGLEPEVTIGIQNFIWITPSWAEKLRTERRQFW